jgi:hypothetical protein
MPWLSLALACSDGEARDTRPAAADSGAPEDGIELIPAEWTVAEDTSTTGEVITASMQLPAAREIAGLMEQEGTPRLLLRCLNGKVAAFIDAPPPDIPDLAAEPVPVPLDSAPSCE